MRSRRLITTKVRSRRLLTAGKVPKLAKIEQKKKIKKKLKIELTIRWKSTISTVVAV